MDNELGSEIGITTERLNNAWREDLLSDFDDLEASIWSKWRGLQNDAVSGHESWNELAERQDNWEIPRADGCHDT
jgi:hypothetical protein